ncbi:hypothetical protein JCM11251_001815 [Rhodosporidiobolus azoricus]
MRLLLLIAPLFATLALAEPLLKADHAPRANRIAVGFGNAGDTRERAPSAGKAKEASVNYLVTLDRSITNSAKDKILDVLLRSGAVVKEEYNYRVYKGILFTIPSSTDKGLSAWETSLTRETGVKYVEEDQLVKTQ